MFVIVTMDPAYSFFMHHFIYLIKQVQKYLANAYLANVLHIITGMQMSY